MGKKGELLLKTVIEVGRILLEYLAEKRNKGPRDDKSS